MFIRVSLPQRIALLITLGVAAAGLAGCGSSKAVLERASGSRTAPAGPFDYQKYAQRSTGPVADVLRLLYYAETDDLTDLPTTYSSLVRRTLGDSLIAGALSSQSGALVSSAPTALLAVSTPSGSLVTVRIGGGSKSFNLVNERGHWLVAHDTLLESAIGPYVEYQTQQRMDPTAKKLSKGALRAALGAEDCYRELGVAVVGDQSTTQSNLAKCPGRASTGSSLPGTSAPSTSLTNPAPTGAGVP